VYFTTLGAENRRWNGTVRQILPAPPRPETQGTDAQAASAGAPGGTGKVVLYTVLFDVPNHDGALLPQMSAQVFFVTASARRVVVAPLPALQAIADKPGWYDARVLADGHVQARQVRTGVHDRLHAEVLSGLEAGDSLVTAIHRERAGAGKFQW
jgi:macrolide-specific efflux system membrane fusion protein